MRADRIDVQELEPGPPRKPPIAGSPRFSVRNWSRALGIAGTLSLHGLAVHSLILGSVQHKPHLPQIKGGGAKITATSAEELILVTVAASSKNDPDLPDQIASLQPHLDSSPISIATPDFSAAEMASTEEVSEYSSSAPALDAGDPALRASMFGRYTRQIGARIERVWMRPRSLVNETTDSARNDQEFKCRVQIRQDERGNVQEVLLIQCNGTEAWRRSLVVAINQSSPLPAPPIPSIFTRAVTMVFEAQAYRPGSPSDAYESEPQAAEAGVFATRAGSSSVPRNTIVAIRGVTSP
jgi:hypothetical protein